MGELGTDNFFIELIKECSCENVEQLRAEEGIWIRELGTFNKKIECRADAEYYQDNKERILERNRTYNQEHEEELLEKKQQYFESNKDDILNKQKNITKESKK